MEKTKIYRLMAPALCALVFLSAGKARRGRECEHIDHVVGGE